MHFYCAIFAKERNERKTPNKCCGYCDHSVLAFDINQSKRSLERFSKTLSIYTFFLIFCIFSDLFAPLTECTFIFIFVLFNSNFFNIHSQHNHFTKYFIYINFFFSYLWSFYYSTYYFTIVTSLLDIYRIRYFSRCSSSIIYLPS